MNRQLFHFEPPKGWMNDPNGLCQKDGVYHIFYQHNPYSLKWDRMHWGHATSSDLLHFEHQPIALFPDEPYENEGGCFSGSAIVKDGVIHLFYTSVSREMGQTQSTATCTDGLHFVKSEENPLIITPPAGSNRDFRDPKVSLIDGHYYMVVAGGENGVGMIFLYRSDDLTHWESLGILLSGSEYGPILECPDFFKMGDKYFLSFSMVSDHPYRVITLVGDFDGQTFSPEKRFDTESGPDYYAPQSFADESGRRISFGWIHTWREERPKSDVTTGALTVPREVSYENGILRHYPIKALQNLLVTSDPHVLVEGNKIRLFDGRKVLCEREYPHIDCVEVLRDLNIIEVFVNKGEYTATFWYFE
ncbi:MAG: glycoside hydrolase family 32 protein [Eubacteriales bacterium]